MASVDLIVRGRVQGVGFRRFVQKRAQELQVTGTVRNLADGSVEVRAEGPGGKLQAFVEIVRNGPAYARVSEVLESWGDREARVSGFEVIV
jgi:acylphosphatase